MKKTLCVITLFILITSTLIPAYGADRYSDLKASHWAYACIEEMSENNIISGYPDGSFKPDKKVTYAEFIKLIYTSCVKDTLVQPESGHWATNYYWAGLKAGFYSGSDVNFADLDREIPRKAMALMISNGIAAGISEADDRPWISILSEIKDVDQASEFAYEIAMSYDAGILNGYPDGAFAPEKGLIRSEAAAAIYRLIEKTDHTAYKDNTAEPEGSFKVTDRDYTVNKFKVKPGYNGIEKFVYSSESDCIGVYSDRIQDVSLFINSNKLRQVVNTENEYWQENGSFVYVFKADGLYTENAELGIAFGLYMDEVYYYVK